MAGGRHADVFACGVDRTVGSFEINSGTAVVQHDTPREAYMNFLSAQGWWILPLN